MCGPLYAYLPPGVNTDISAVFALWGVFMPWMNCNDLQKSVRFICEWQTSSASKPLTEGLRNKLHSGVVTP